MLAITHILCPVDFSPASRQALDHAIALAHWNRAKVSVLYVHRPTMPLFTAAPVVLPTSADLTLDERERRDLLAGMARFVEPARAGVPVDLELRQSPMVAATIVSVAEELDVDVVVMGTAGRTGVTRLLLGSVTESVLRACRRPVLTVTPRLPDAVAPSLQWIDRVVCAVDFSPNARRALDYAVALCEAAGARLTVAHIVELPLDLVTPQATLADRRLQRFSEAHARLNTLVTPDLRARCPIDPILLAGTPAVELTQLAFEQQAGVLVIGAHGHGVIDAVIRGTTTDQIVRQAPCPVLTVRAGARHHAEAAS